MKKLRRPASRKRRNLLETLEKRMMLSADWQNPARPNDVNNDLEVSPLDALLVINEVARSGARELGARQHRLERFYDTTADGEISPIDALSVINQIQRGEGLTVTRGEGESEPAPAGFISVPFGILPGDSTQIVELSSQINIVREEFNEIGLFIYDGPEGEVAGVDPDSPSYPNVVFSQAERRVLYSRQDVPRDTNEVVMPAGSIVGVYVLQGASDNGTPDDHPARGTNGNIPASNRAGKSTSSTRLGAGLVIVVTMMYLSTFKLARQELGIPSLSSQGSPANRSTSWQSLLSMSTPPTPIYRTTHSRSRLTKPQTEWRSTAPRGEFPGRPRSLRGRAFSTLSFVPLTRPGCSTLKPLRSASPK